MACGTVEGRCFIAAGGGDTVRLWDTAAASSSAGRPGGDGPVQTGVFTTIDGEVVMVTGGRDGTVRLWDLRMGGPLLSPLIQSTPGFGSLVTSVATGVVDGQPVVISASRAGPAKRWNARTGECLGPLAFPLRRSWDRRTLWSPVETVALGVVDGGLAIGTASSLLVVDVPGLRPLPPAPGS